MSARQRLHRIDLSTGTDTAIADEGRAATSGLRRSHAVPAGAVGVDAVGASGSAPGEHIDPPEHASQQQGRLKPCDGSGEGGLTYTFQDSEWDGDSHPLLQSPAKSTEGPSPRSLRARAGLSRSPLQDLDQISTRNKCGRGIKKKSKCMRGQWTSTALKLAMDTLDTGYPMSQVCKKYGIPRSSLRDHYVGKRKSRKSGPAGVLTTAEEEELVHYSRLGSP